MKDAAGTPLNCAGVVVEHFLSPFYSSASPGISSTVSLSLSLSLNCQLPILMPWIQTSSIALSVLSFYFQSFSSPPPPSPPSLKPTSHSFFCFFLSGTTHFPSHLQSRLFSPHLSITECRSLCCSSLLLPSFSPSISVSFSLPLSDVTAPIRLLFPLSCSTKRSVFLSACLSCVHYVYMCASFQATC